MASNTREKIFTVHNHFNMFRDLHEQAEGEVTDAEILRSIERFIRYHQRQVEIGQTLLAKAQAQLNADAPKTPPPVNPDEPDPQTVVDPERLPPPQTPRTIPELNAQ